MQACFSLLSWVEGKSHRSPVVEDTRERPLSFFLILCRLFLWQETKSSQRQVRAEIWAALPPGPLKGGTTCNISMHICQESSKRKGCWDASNRAELFERPAITQDFFVSCPNHTQKYQVHEQAFKPLRRSVWVDYQRASTEMSKPQVVHASISTGSFCISAMIVRQSLIVEISGYKTPSVTK